MVNLISRIFKINKDANQTSLSITEAADYVKRNDHKLVNDLYSEFESGKTLDQVYDELDEETKTLSEKLKVNIELDLIKR